MEEHDYERVVEDDPRRCQGRTKAGSQCILKSVPGGTYCIVHGGATQLKSEKKANLRNYNLERYRQRISELADNPALKNLSEEIGILRMTLENTLTLCHTPTDLMLKQSIISDTILKIEKLVTSCHKLDKDMSGLIGREDLQKLAGDIIMIIGEHVPAGDIESVAMKLQIAIARMSNG